MVRVLELSPQQVRLVESLLRSMRDKQIATELGVTVPTVRTYMTRLFHKLDVEDRVELVVRIFVVAREIESRTRCR